MRAESSASSAVRRFGSSSLRTPAPAAIAIAAFVLSRCREGRTGTSERDVRNHGIALGTVKTISAIPTTTMTNRVVGGGAVRATVKNAIAHSRIASLRANASAISNLLLYEHIHDESSTGRTTLSATRDVRRAIARSSSRDGPAFTPPGTRVLGRMTTATNAMTTPTINNIGFSPLSGPLSPYRDPCTSTDPLSVRLCTGVERVNPVGARHVAIAFDDGVRAAETLRLTGIERRVNAAKMTVARRSLARVPISTREARCPCESLFL
jgi:hypothetical protein